MLTRRRTLHALGVASVSLLAGCSAIDSDPKPGSLLVVNNSPNDYTLHLDITHDGETREETVSIGPSEWGLRNNLLVHPGTYEITVTGDSVASPATADETATVAVEVTGSDGNLDGENLEVVIDESGGLRAVARRYD